MTKALFSVILYLMRVQDILNKLKNLRKRVTTGERKVKRLHVKGLGVIIVNENGTHADLSRWK